jgi:hypothetical protein
MASQVTLEPLSTKEDYIEEFEAFDENGAAVDLTAATIVFAVVDKNSKSPILSASTDDGKITVSTTVATVTIPQSEIDSVDPKDYAVGCVITLNSVPKQFFIGTISIYDGLVP